MESAQRIRKHLTPARGSDIGFLSTLSRDMRKNPRREVSERVALTAPNLLVEGWTLNMNRGGLRVIVEGQVSLGHAFDVIVGARRGADGRFVDALLVRRARVVWLQQEPDGFVLGLAWL